jgi:hypothetical protein
MAVYEVGAARATGGEDPWGKPSVNPGGLRIAAHGEVPMQSKVRYLRKWYDTYIPVPLFGLAIGMGLFVLIRAISPHPGGPCLTLGQLTEEWELGMSTKRLMCVATLDGDLRYDHIIAPQKRARY